jgi:indolepyruvate ferredoxin oxidoreductase beta subunit
MSATTTATTTTTTTPPAAAPAKVTNVKIAGVGGMGVLTSTRILAEVFFRRGLDVKKAEVHGMSQRGGSVCSDVRFGQKVFSPMIPAGGTDFLVLFQDDQEPIYAADCSPATVVLRASALDLSKLKNKRALNTAMIGMLSREFAGVPEAEWLAVIRDFFPEKLHEANVEAFALGRDRA